MRAGTRFAIAFLAVAQTVLLAQLVPTEPPVEARIPVPPAPARINGRTALVYELHLTNLFSKEVRLNRIEVFGAGSRTILTYQDDALVQAIRQYGPASQTADPRTIPAGFSEVVHLWVSLDKSQPAPRAVRHRLSFSVPAADGKLEDRYLNLGDLPVAQAKEIVISPPFGPGKWLAGNGPSNSSSHRRAALLAGGHSYLPERFAIDWVKLSDDGKLWREDPKINANWYCYGAEVLAVADGVVASIKDGIPENVPLSPTRAVPITLETIGGNYVVVALGNGAFAFFAHLQPGSLRVKPGDRVKRRQVLGLLGNSGSSDAPHLHFHISDGNSLESEGLPYVFDSFEVLGTADLDRALEDGWKPAAGTSAQKRVREIPAENAVVRFGKR